MRYKIKVHAKRIHDGQKVIGTFEITMNTDKAAKQEAVRRARINFGQAIKIAKIEILEQDMV